MTDTFEAPSQTLYDVDAEAATLGAMLLDPNVITEVEGVLAVESFHLPAHRLVFGTLIALRADGKETDPISVTAHLIETGRIRRIPDHGVFIADLTAKVPSAANGMHYAQIVADRAVLRALDAACTKVQDAIRAGAGTSAEQVERARILIGDIASHTAGGEGPMRWRDLIRPGLDGIEAADTLGGGPSGIPTGFRDLDDVIHGLESERLIVVAGRPGAGKSLLTADFARSAAFGHGVPTLMFNMEMPWQELFNRLVCAQAGVRHKRAVAGGLDDSDWTALARVCAATTDAPLWIDDSKNLTLADIRVRARKMRQRHDVRLIVVDYLGLIAARGVEPRHQQVGEIARGLKLLAGELGVSVVLCAQINRASTQRNDKRPGLADLAESGQVEAHADVVIFVHRDEQHDAKSKRQGEADLIVAKNRGGEQTDVVLAAQMHYSRFSSMAMGVA